MPATEPLIAWPEPWLELLGFVAVFLAAGAVGFWWTSLGRVATGGPSEELTLLARAAQRAAVLGLIGALVTLVRFATRVPALAERNHLTAAEFLATPAGATQAVLLLLVAAGLGLAIARVRLGWIVATAALVCSVIRPVVFAGWLRAVKPAHEFAGGLWIGTLFMLVALGLVPLLRSSLDSAQRGALAARMVNAFSPLALASAGLLAALGVIAAWVGLKRLDALWTTPYGIALLVKLGLVGIVVALGAWNWRRQKPRLGTEAGARDLRRSATAELAIAGMVLAVTAILVSLPSPK